MFPDILILREALGWSRLLSGAFGVALTILVTLIIVVIPIIIIVIIILIKK